jgi:hypothetical protein
LTLLLNALAALVEQPPAGRPKPFRVIGQRAVEA